jgi:hypothetical protein
MNAKEKEYIAIANTIQSMRLAINKLNESDGSIGQKENNEGAVPYTKQDEMLKNSLQPCRTQFGADFSKLKSPMLYYTEDGDITLSGIIPSLNNAKFQYRYLEPSGNGCFLWVDGIQLTDDTINRINKIYGVYKNWRQQLSTSEDNKPLALKNEQ